MTYTILATVRHSWFNAKRGYQDEEIIEVCHSVMADTADSAKEKAIKEIEQWIEDGWPDLSEMPPYHRDHYWVSVKPSNVSPTVIVVREVK